MGASLTPDLGTATEEEKKKADREKEQRLVPSDWVGSGPPHDPVSLLLDEIQLGIREDAWERLMADEVSPALAASAGESAFLSLYDLKGPPVEYETGRLAPEGEEYENLAPESRFDIARLAPDDPFALANADAIAYAKQRAGQLITDIPQSTLDSLRPLIAQALDEGWSPARLADALEEHAAFSKYRAMLIARTELADAHVQGTLAGWNRSGVVAGKRSVLGSRHDEDDICDANAEQGVIAMGDTFSSGDDGPPYHPNCVCALIPVTADEMEALKVEQTFGLRKYSEDQPRDEHGRFAGGAEPQLPLSGPRPFEPAPKAPPIAPRTHVPVGVFPAKEFAAAALRAHSADAMWEVFGKYGIDVSPNSPNAYEDVLRQTGDPSTAAIASQWMSGQFGTRGTVGLRNFHHWLGILHQGGDVSGGHFITPFSFGATPQELTDPRVVAREDAQGVYTDTKHEGFAASPELGRAMHRQFSAQLAHEHDPEFTELKQLALSGPTGMSQVLAKGKVIDGGSPGWVGNVVPPEKAPPEQRAMVERVAARDGWDAKKVVYIDHAPVAKMGNSLGEVEGSYNPNTKTIWVYTDSNAATGRTPTDEQTLTHESFHLRYDAVKAASGREYRLAEAAGDIEPASHSGSSLPQLKAGVEGKYPAYALFSKSLGTVEGQRGLWQEDGVTEYSRAMWENPSSSGPLSTEETMAEIERVQSYSKTDRPALTGWTPARSPHLMAFMHGVDAQYQRLRKEGKA